MRSLILYFVVVTLAFTSCDSVTSKKFKQLSKTESGLDFNNHLPENDSLNYFTYAYMYMGGGVSVGDINNDGLPDVYVTGNMVPNKLFLNKGNMKFEDITEKANVAGDGRWYTGTTMADVNSDGLLDIYVSVSGKFEPRNNQLFVNNGDLTFTESAVQYGLDDPGESIQASFFDYDKDGDLDMFLANYPSISFATPNLVYQHHKEKKHPSKSDKLYQQQPDGTFKDVSVESGIANFGLAISATIDDFNNDGYEDIYVSNDFSTPDFMYMNNGDGTFTDKLQETVKQTSFYGMGTDAADINNDGLIDLFQVDMASQNNRRQKANMASMNPNLFWSTVNAGFHYQYMYNSFQLNQGIVDGIPKFSNIAWITGTSSTDWSWCPLFADFDNDGLKDLFISNGTRKEINNRDFFGNIKNLSPEEKIEGSLQLSLQLPEEPIDNYIFRNTGNSSFKKANEDWSLSYVGFSNGAAYADFDNDGDLDLLINNIDSDLAFFENNTDTEKQHYIQIKLVGGKLNPNGLSSKVTARTGETVQTVRVTTSRGYQSSIEPFAFFGLGEASQVDEITVEWSDGTFQRIENVDANQFLEIRKESSGDKPTKENAETLLVNATDRFDSVFYHYEDGYNDFYHQVLLPHRMSNFGPALAKGDLNGDGLEDIFVGNGTNYPSRTYLQNADGTFSTYLTGVEQDSIYEDLDALIFDADGDGDNDLYVVSGGNSFPKDAWEYEDRLYINIDGKLTRSMESIPANINASGSRVFPKDYDNDGDIDLLVGGRLSPHEYPAPGRTILLENQSSGQDVVQFVNVTRDVIPQIESIGMVTDARWVDLNGDKTEELVVVGEWMDITTFEWNNGSLAISTAYDLDQHAGWWFSVANADIDNDGDQDLIVGNLGLNYKYQATETETFDLFVDDFDSNDSKDLVLGYFSEGEQFPVRGRQCSSEQIPTIQLKFEDYKSFASASLEDIYGKKGLENALHLQVKSFSSKVMLNNGDGSFTSMDLPLQAQYAPINDILIRDLNSDDKADLIVAGNLYASEVETPRADAGIGLVMMGNGDGTFEPLTIAQSGLVLDQDIKNLNTITTGDQTSVLAVGNQGTLQLFELR